MPSPCVRCSHVHGPRAGPGLGGERGLYSLEEEPQPHSFPSTNRGPRARPEKQWEASRCLSSLGVTSVPQGSESGGAGGWQVGRGAIVELTLLGRC